MACLLIVCLLSSSFKYDDRGAGQLVLGPFAGNTPAGYFIRPLLGIPLNADCDRVQWSITLYRDPATHKPSVFKLNCIYGLQANSAPGFAGGGNELKTEGTWTITKGAKNNADATVYQLNSTSGHEILFVKMDDNILHLLYTDESLMIGHAGWSYTLSRIKTQ